MICKTLNAPAMTNVKIIKYIHLILAALWCYQGLIPKLIFTSPDEIAVWQWIGFSTNHAVLLGQFSGVIEMIFGLLFLCVSHKFLHYLSMVGLFFLLILIGFVIPDTLIRAFNPVVMNIAMISLSWIALQLWPKVP